jgi:hypothetical protein
MKTAKVTHSSVCIHSSFRLSIESIRRKIENGAHLRFFPPSTICGRAFFSLKVPSKNGKSEKTFFFDFEEELMQLPHEKV